MAGKKERELRVAFVGGGKFGKEVLERIYPVLDLGNNNLQVLAVADPDPASPFSVLARELGLRTVTNHRELYDIRPQAQVIILLDPKENILHEIIETKPAGVQVVPYNMFLFFWKAMNAEWRNLRKRNEEIETILDSIQDFILVITPQMEIVEVNRSFLDQMGYTREEVIGRKCHEVFQKINRQCSFSDIVCPLNEVILNKRPSQQVLTRVDHRGEQRYIEVTIFPMWEKQGKISKFIEISRDITERKRQDEEITRRLEEMVEQRTRELKETHAKLLHQDKMASLGKLSASVVHEVNNPITGILNLTMLMKRILDEGAPGEKELKQFRNYLELMDTETRRISRIVSNLLAFSRQSKMEPKLLNLNKVIEKTLLLNANLLKINRVQIEKELDPELPELVGSEDQLQQVFMNLVSNAVEAMENTGEKRILGIKTRNASEQGKLYVSFRDTGVGIPPEDLSRLFEPFFTTKKKGKGVGLGLSVAYGIVEEHGGSIRVRSRVGEGSTFTVELPLRKEMDGQIQLGELHGHS
ncbi:MAG: hypothetical protein DRH11_09395 [Deltaproteobacteria bacterium]|nr:MAG: hypothetical protein DRH11_09395 [Deltaproteobacteria bacterium]